VSTPSGGRLRHEAEIIEQRSTRRRGHTGACSASWRGRVRRSLWGRVPACTRVFRVTGIADSTKGGQGRSPATRPSRAVDSSPALCSGQREWWQPLPA
jgi:hypothetical protein